MPKRRKGLRPFTPPIPFLLDDAQQTRVEIEGEPDPRKRKKRERARDNATAELMRVYRKANRDGALRTLDPSVRLFCEWIIKNDPARAAKAAKARTGPPDQSERRMRIAVAVVLEIEARGQRRGSVEQALNAVASRFDRTYDAIKKIHYENDPAWQRELKASVSMWKLHELVRTDPRAAGQHRRRFERRHGKLG